MTNYDTITIRSAYDLIEIDGTNAEERIRELAAGRDLTTLSVIADANVGPWGLIALDEDTADSTIKALDGSDMDANSSEYAAYCDAIAQLPEYLGNL